MLRLAEIALLSIEGSLLTGFAVRTFAEIRLLAAAGAFAEIAAITGAFAVAWASIATRPIAVARLAIGLQHLFAAPAAVVELAVRRLDVVLAVFVLDRLVVFHALAVI